MNLTDLFKLSGIVIVIIGLALRLRTTLVVMTAALVTGLAAGLPLFSSEGIFEAFPFLTKPGQEGIIIELERIPEVSIKGLRVHASWNGGKTADEHSGSVPSWHAA